MSKEIELATVKAERQKHHIPSL